MVLNDVSFINMMGEEINLNILISQMIKYYNDKLEIGETKITDFNEGSEIRNLLEAFSILIFNLLEDVNEATKLPFISSSYGVWLDEIGENPFINLPRIEGNVATGYVTFSLSEPQLDDIVIPSECLLEDNNGLEYITVEDCIINGGELNTNVEVECLTEGDDGNVSAGSICKITDETVDSDLISVSNPESLSNGSDYEDDDDYRERLLANVREYGFGTLPYYTEYANSIDGVHDVVFVDDENYTRKILVNGFDKPTPDKILLEVLALFSDEENKILNHTFTVDRPIYVPANLSIYLDVKTEFSEEKLLNHLTAFFNGGDSFMEVKYEGLNIGENINGKDIETIFLINDAIKAVTVLNYGEITDFESDLSEQEVLKVGSIEFIQNLIN